MKNIRGKVGVVIFVFSILYFLGALLDVGYACFFGPGFWRPTLSCENSIYDYGDIEKTDHLVLNSVNFMIQNTGNRSLSVIKVTPGCGGCVEVLNFPHHPIPPHSESLITVRLLPSNLSGSVDKSILVKSDDPLRPVFLLHLKANILSPKE
ncbi:MAG: DUF1573 domain-containing protein [Planctomycetaceae bacterium]|jgi:hypothetical protein|nr:DUF1573 domain-containing protein [Planctomycetaceae bacterium]